MPAIIYLVRHAEAEGNLYRRCQGHYDSRLTPRGLIQAEALRRRFKDVRLDAVYSSPLFRTRMTAKPIADDHKLEVRVKRDLIEIRLGAWEDRPWGELPLLYPEAYRCWEHEPWVMKIPDGEEQKNLQKRMTAAIVEIAAEVGDSGSALAVSHGAAMRSFLCCATGRRLEEINEMTWCDNTAVSLIKVSADGEITVEYANDNSHLSEGISTLGTQRWWRDGNAQKDFNMWFKPARLPQDAQKVLEYAGKFYEAAYGSTDGLDEETFLSETGSLADSFPGSVTFAMLGQKDVGFLRFFIEYAEDPEAVFIHGLYLKPEFRERGFAPQLLGQVVSVARANGKKRVRVKTEKSNRPAVAFYEKYGFEKISDDGKTAEFLLDIEIHKP